jgi:hypothetical protein
MAAHYIAIDRAKQGTAVVDYVFDTSSTAAGELEVRIEDAPGWTRAEVAQRLRRIAAMMESGAIGGSNFPIL